MKRLSSFAIFIILLSYTLLQPLFITENSYVKAHTDTKNLYADTICRDTLRKLSETLTKPDIGTIGGDWSILCLARGEYEEAENELYDSYLKRVQISAKQLAESSGRNDGSLHRSKSTENSRVILALSSIGADPRNINSIDLVKPLEDTDWVKKQGLNGIIFALIAVDSCSYPYPENLHEKLIETILQNQLSDGGWSLDNSSADPDITSIALQALSNYTYRPEISEAVNNGLNCLSTLFMNYFENEKLRNSETLSQIITACTCCGRDPENNPDFIYNGTSVLNELLSYYDPDVCSFRHIKTGNVNSMASDQALIALISYKRMISNKPGIYNMNEINNYSPYPDVIGTSLDIKEGLILKIYLKAEDNIVDTYVKVNSMTSKEVLADIDFNNTQKDTCKRNIHIISVPIKYSRITDTLRISVYSKEMSYKKNLVYSVNSYLESLERNTKDSILSELAANLISLGNDIQKYTAHETDGAYKITDVSDSFPEFIPAKYPVSIADTPDSVKYLGSELIIDSNILVRHKFQLDNKPDNFSEYIKDENGNLIVQKESILTPVCFFDTAESVTPFGNIYFSAGDYLGYVWMHTDNAELKQLCCSVYNYEKSVKLFYNL